MKKLTLNIPDDRFLFIMELMNQLGIDTDQKSQTDIELDPEKNLIQGLKELREVTEGKLSVKSIGEFFNGI